MVPWSVEYCHLRAIQNAPVPERADDGTLLPERPWAISVGKGLWAGFDVDSFCSARPDQLIKAGDRIKLFKIKSKVQNPKSKVGGVA